MKKFTLRIGGTEIELEGRTREEAIKKVGLNPEHWQEDRGEKMNTKKVKPISQPQPIVENIPKKQTAGKTKVDTKPNYYHRRPNITIEDIGRWYTDGIDVWKLDVFIPEPQVTMSKVASMENDPKSHETKSGYLSDFKDFRRLIPEPESRKRIKKQT